MWGFSQMVKDSGRAAPTQLHIQREWAQITALLSYSTLLSNLGSFITTGQVLAKCAHGHCGYKHHSCDLTFKILGVTATLGYPLALKFV